MRHLRMLVLLDTHLQTSKTAAVLNVTQPAVSKSLADLEQGLGIKLFERNARGLTPTAAGNSMILCARAILQNLADTGEELDAISRGAMMPIRVGVLPAVATSLLPICLARLKDIVPSTAVFVREATMDSLVSELRSGGIELIVGVLSEIESYRDLDEEVLFVDPTIFVARSGHPLASTDDVTLVKMAQYPWVLPPMQSLLGRSLMDWFHSSGVPRPTNSIETLSFSVIRRYLAMSDAIATVPQSIALDPHWAEEFHVLPIAPPTLVRPVGISWYRERPQTEGTRLFMQCMRSIVEEHNFTQA